MTALVKIGNSRGVRIPKHLIAQTGLAGRELALETHKNGLLIKPIDPPRAGWHAAFAKAKGKKDAGLCDDFLDLDLNVGDWEW